MSAHGPPGSIMPHPKTWAMPRREHGQGLTAEGLAWPGLGVWPTRYILVLIFGDTTQRPLSLLMS